MSDAGSRRRFETEDCEMPVASTQGSPHRVALPRLERKRKVLMGSFDNSNALKTLNVDHLVVVAVVERL